MLTQEAIFIATIKGTSLVIKTRPFCKNEAKPIYTNHDCCIDCIACPDQRSAGDAYTHHCAGSAAVRGGAAVRVGGARCRAVGAARCGRLWCVFIPIHQRVCTARS